ncbi:MAG: hypothetical protein HYX71_11345 [Opitutae bacterium]|nr:hypothetical protein [Opitutae bacterium]
MPDPNTCQSIRRVLIDEIAGYIVSDIEAFPDVPFWIIPKDVVTTWWREQQLGSTTKISRDKAHALLATWQP